MQSQQDKARRFRELHEQTAAFVIPNPWDAGTARLLELLGFKALATTSAGFAFSLGRADGQVSRAEMLEHVSAVVAATSLPVSADLENGYGDAPEVAAETIRMAVAAGLVGGSIEDATGRKEEPIYEIAAAADRVRAAAEAARGSEIDFVLTARAENYLHGRPDLRDTIARLQAFQEAGADVLYAPGIRTEEEIRAVVSSVDRPVNVVMGLSGAPWSVAELSSWGVRRISVGSALSRAALGSFLRAAREMKERGTFEFADEAVSVRELSELLG